MKDGANERKPQVKVVFAVGDGKQTLQETGGYRMVLHCSKQEPKTGSKAQTANGRM